MLQKKYLHQGNLKEAKNSSKSYICANYYAIESRSYAVGIIKLIILRLSITKANPLTRQD